MSIFMAVRCWLITVLLGVGILADFRHFNFAAFALVLGVALVPWRALFGRGKAVR